jgi:hypothetical protein
LYAVIIITDRQAVNLQIVSGRKSALIIPLQEYFSILNTYVGVEFCSNFAFLNIYYSWTMNIHNTYVEKACNNSGTLTFERNFQKDLLDSE